MRVCAARAARERNRRWHVPAANESCVVAHPLLFSNALVLEGRACAYALGAEARCAGMPDPPSIHSGHHRMLCARAGLTQQHSVPKVGLHTAAHSASCCACLLAAGLLRECEATRAVSVAPLLAIARRAVRCPTLLIDGDHLAATDQQYGQHCSVGRKQNGRSRRKSCRSGATHEHASSRLCSNKVSCGRGQMPVTPVSCAGNVPAVRPRALISQPAAPSQPRMDV